MYVQIFRQAILFQNQFELLSKVAGRHGQLHPMSAENIVIGSQFAFIIGFRFLLTKFSVLFQQTCHLSGEVHVSVVRSGFGFFHNNIFTGNLDHIPADMDGLLFEIHIAPFEATALAPAHTGGNNQFKVSFIFDTFFLQSNNEFLRSLLDSVYMS